MKKKMDTFGRVFTLVVVIFSICVVMIALFYGNYGRFTDIKAISVEEVVQVNSSEIIEVLANNKIKNADITTLHYDNVNVEITSDTSLEANGYGYSIIYKLNAGELYKENVERSFVYSHPVIMIIIIVLICGLLLVFTILTFKINNVVEQSEEVLEEIKDNNLDNKSNKGKEILVEEKSSENSARGCSLNLNHNKKHLRELNRIIPLDNGRRDRLKDDFFISKNGEITIFIPTYTKSDYEVRTLRQSTFYNREQGERLERFLKE
jgi:hypothetical protein